MQLLVCNKESKKRREKAFRQFKELSPELRKLLVEVYKESKEGHLQMYSKAGLGN